MALSNLELPDWQATFDAVTDAIFLLDSGHRILRANRICETLFQRPLDEIVGRRCFEVVHPELGCPHPDCPCPRVQLSGRRESMTLPIGDRHFEVTLDPFFAPEGDCRGGVHILRDITERTRGEAERLRFIESARHSQKLESLGVMAGGIAHDFNNLLTAILGHADLSRNDLPPGHPVAESLEEIIKAGRKAAAICRQMLAYSGRSRFVVEPLDPGRVARDMMQLLQASVSKRARLEFRLAEGLPRTLADASQIHQILLDLVINASEAIGDRDGRIVIATGSEHCDGPLLEAIRVDGRLPAGPYVWLEVADDGCGMSREALEHLYEPFYSTKFVGRGLGMPAVLGIVRGHRGGIRIESAPERGTRVRIYLPAEGAAPAPEPAPAVAPASWSGRGTVLLVDDEASVRKVGERILKRLGFSVLTAGDGLEALERLAEVAGAVDCVLLDLTMPRLDGGETFREIHRRWPGLPVLLASGYSLTEIAGRFAGAGLAGYLAKPYDLKSLEAKLRELFGD